MSQRSAPRVVGRYLLQDRIASGGMATVYLGRSFGEQNVSRTVAIKQLYQHLATDEEFVRMFVDEAQLLSHVYHTNVVSVLELLPLDGEFFIVMNYVHGPAVSALAKAARGPVPAPLAAAIAYQTLLGLHAAHEATDDAGARLNIVHRDVSPQNILVGVDGAVRLVDFGIARAASRPQTTNIGVLKGKMGYFAPEQLRHEPLDHRADLFGVGIVLWELLTGRRLFTLDAGATLNNFEKEAIQPPSTLVPGLSAELDALVLRALSSRASDRHPSARSMAAALDAATPLAAALELGSWVEQLMGPELGRRAQRIADLHALSPEDLTLALQPPLQPGALYPARAAADSSAPVIKTIAPPPERADVSAAPLGQNEIASRSRPKQPPRASQARTIATMIALGASVGVVVALGAGLLASPWGSSSANASADRPSGGATSLARSPGGASKSSERTSEKVANAVLPEPSPTPAVGETHEDQRARPALPETSNRVRTPPAASDSPVPSASSREKASTVSTAGVFPPAEHLDVERGSTIVTAKSPPTGSFQPTPPMPPRPQKSPPNTRVERDASRPWRER